MQGVNLLIRSDTATQRLVSTAPNDISIHTQQQPLRVIWGPVARPVSHAASPCALNLENHEEDGHASSSELELQDPPT